MLLNNRGWGLRYIIVIICVTALILIFTSLRIRAFIRDNRDSNKTSENGKKSKDTRDDANLYSALEIELEEAGEAYIIYHETLLEYSTDHVIVSYDTLKDEGFINGLPDPASDKNCDGYVMIYDDSSAKGFISCEKYETMNYDLWVD